MNIIKKTIIYLLVIGLVSSCTTTSEKESYQDIDAKAGLVIHRRSGAALPFKRARLANSAAVAATLGSHIKFAEMMGK